MVTNEGRGHWKQGSRLGSRHDCDVRITLDGIFEVGLELSEARVLQEGEHWRRRVFIALVVGGIAPLLSWELRLLPGMPTCIACGLS